MTSLFLDLKQAWRSLRKTPGATVVIVVTLALGIGANVAIFSVLNGVILQPLPYPQPQQLVLLTSKFTGLGFDRFWISPPEYLEYREWNQSMIDVGAYNTGEISLVGAEQPLRLRAAFASASLFTVLGVEPERGRVYNAEEDLPNAESVVVVSHELWQNAFGGDESLVGRKVEVNGQPATVVGVMPPGFDIEENDVQVWVPLGLDPADHSARGSHYLYLAARLGPGVTLEQARAELDGMLQSWAERVGGETHVPRPDGHPLQMKSLHEEVVGNTRPAVLALFGAVAFVLLIACANVANVMLARSEARQKEIAIRNSVGASRFRLLRMLFVESLLLSIVGGSLGVVLAQFGLQALLAASPDSLPRIDEIHLSPVVLLFALAVALVTGVLFGIAPALQLRLDRLGALMKESAQRTSASGAALAFRRALVVGEVALAVGLVVGAGLMLRSLDALLSVDAGFEPDHLTAFQLSMPASRYPEAADIVGAYDRVTKGVAAIPGVTAVTTVSGLPPTRRVNANDMEFEGLERSEDGPPQNIDYWQFITPEYFDTMGIRLLEGRGFTAADDGQGTPVAVVNRRAAEVFWPDRSPIGQRLRPGYGDFPFFTVVGVAEDVKQGGLDKPAGTEVYWSVPQVGEKLGFVPRTMYVVLRSSMPTAALADSLRRAVWQVDASLPVAGLRSMLEVFGASVARARFLTLLLSIFGTLALLLSAIGIYGVMSYTVAERAREMGIRMAIGADRSRVLGLVMGQGAVLAVSGLLLGTAAAWGLSRLLGSLLFGVGATDPATYASVLLLLLLSALVACGVPALRATRVNPISVLRSE